MTTSAKGSTNDDEICKDVTVFDVAAKLIRRDTNWSKAEVDDAVLWAKVVCAIVIGAGWGCIPITGGSGIASGLLAIALGNLYFVRHAMEIDEEEYGGKLSLLLEGLASAVATFFLTWILVYSVVNGGS